MKPGMAVQATIALLYIVIFCFLLVSLMMVLDGGRRDRRDAAFFVGGCLFTWGMWFLIQITKLAGML